MCVWRSSDHTFDKGLRCWGVQTAENIRVRIKQRYAVSQRKQRSHEELHLFTCYTSTQAQTHTCTHAHTHTHKRTHTHRDEGLHIIGLQHAWRHLLGGPAARQLQAGMCSARCLRNGLGPLQGGGGGGAREVNKYYSRLECGP